MRFSLAPFCLFVVSNVFAVTWTGSNTPGDWNDTQNWNGASLPSSGDIALFDNTGNATNTIVSLEPYSECQTIQIDGKNYSFNGGLYLYPNLPDFTGIQVTNAQASFDTQSFGITNSGTCAITVNFGASGTFTDCTFYQNSLESSAAYILNGTGSYYF